ncbi:MAG: hypothetical protein MMC33_001775 [Icmadophila ericetorum]|nr:hypothetical protein [Icmadophila ericetorum]
MTVHDPSLTSASASASETSPLLSHFPPPQLSPPRTKASSIRKSVIIGILFLILTSNLPYLLQILPRLRIWEIIYCRRYYEEHDPSLIGEDGLVEEKYCKVESVQSQVAYLKGWYGFFGSLPGLFLAIPYGMLADRYGRKWVLVACITTIWIVQAWVYVVSAFPDVVPLRLIWLGPIVTIIGGGDLVASSLIFTILYDVTPQAKSASLFFYIAATSMLCGMLSPILAGIMMAHDPWISMDVGLGIQILSIPVSLTLPETLGLDKEEGGLLLPAPVEPAITPRSFTFPSLRKQSLWSQIETGFRNFVKNSAFLISDWRIIFLCLVSPIGYLSGLLDEFLPQYVSDRYSWTLANAAYITSINSGTVIIVLLVILPLVSTYLERKQFDSSRKDLLIMRVSIIFQVLGYLAQGLAPNVPLLALGLLLTALAAGGGACRRALMTSYVHKDQVARLYTCVTVLDIIVAALTGPIVAAIFSGGLKKGGGVWLGTPWIGISAILAVMGICYWCWDWGDKEEGREMGLVVLDGLVPVSDGGNREEAEIEGDDREENVIVSGRVQHERTRSASLRKVASR